MPRSRPALTDEERARHREQDRQVAQHAAEKLRHAEGWQRWLACRRHFHPYSLII